MRRARSKPAEVLRAAIERPAGSCIIDSRAVFSVDEARQLLHLRKSSIRREVREGRLRISKRCGRYYLLGQWIWEWLERGELKSRKQSTASVNGHHVTLDGGDK